MVSIHPQRPRKRPDPVSLPKVEASELWTHDEVNGPQEPGLVHKQADKPAREVLGQVATIQSALECVLPTDAHWCSQGEV